MSGEDKEAVIYEDVNIRVVFRGWTFRGSRELVPIDKLYDTVRENRLNGRPDDFGEQGIGIGGMKGD